MFADGINRLAQIAKFHTAHVDHFRRSVINEQELGFPIAYHVNMRRVVIVLEDHDPQTRSAQHRDHRMILTQPVGLFNPPG